MKKILVLLLLVLILMSCSGQPNYQTISNQQVDGYLIYEKESNGLFCDTYYEDIYYSGETFNYGFSFNGCSPGMTYFIFDSGEYIFLHEAIEDNIISLESLLPLLEQLVRHPEEPSSEEADYLWLDFHINGSVVYAYAGGECDQSGRETFSIDEVEYFYEASGCLQEHILFIEVDGEFVPLADLISIGSVDPQLVIPLLTDAN